MATVFKKQFTKPLPEGAELFSRKGQQFARWKDGSGRTRTERVTTGRDGSPRIIAEAATFTAKYRDGSGIVRETPTGCRDETAARSVLSQLVRRAELVRSGVVKDSEDAAADHLRLPLSIHIAAYMMHLKAKGTAKAHRDNVKRQLDRIAADCGFSKLSQLAADKLERWLVDRDTEEMSARTRNTYLATARAFANWCRREKRLMRNPFECIAKADEKADRKRTRRAMTEAELGRLLYVARVRPLADFGREVIELEPDPKQPKRANWTYGKLTVAGLPEAVKLAKHRLRKRPDFIAELESRGRERGLIYKSLVLTGLRKAELASLTVGQLDIDGPLPCLRLDAADEKNRQGATLPLRADLANDLRGWLADKLQSLQSEARRTIGASIPMRLPSESPLFNVPKGLIRILDLDLQAAGIAKSDERGRTLDVHALRHTFGTLLTKGGVAPRTAQEAMRHSSLAMTMGVYTDPKLLDVAGAVAALPELPLDATPKGSPDVAAATGTYGEIPTNDVGLLAPTLAPTSDKSSISGAMADKANPNRSDCRSSVSDAIDKSLASADKACRKAGDETRTRNVQLGRLVLYH